MMNYIPINLKFTQLPVNIVVSSVQIAILGLPKVPILLDIVARGYAIGRIFPF